MNSIALPVISLILGTILGLVSSLIVSLYKQRQTVTEKILDQFFIARKEIVEVLSKLADLRINYDIDDIERDEYRQKVATLYFKNIDLLPIQITNALLTLHACLLNGKGNLFQIKDDCLVKLPKQDYSIFINQFARFKNTKLFSALAFKSKTEKTRQIIAIRLHAQNAIYILNKFASNVELLKMTKNLKKLGI